MKNLIFILIFLVSLCVHSQEKEFLNKLQYNSFSFVPLGFYFDKSTGGVMIYSDLSYRYNKNIFTFSAITGEELIFLGGSSESFGQLNVLYGREHKLYKFIYIDTHLGLGYFSFKSEYKKKKRLTKIGFPLVAKIRFKTGEKFSLGFQFQTNINSVNNIYSSGFLLQWNTGL